MTSIVCGVDDSREARVALRIAAGLAVLFDVRLVAAHVVRPPAPAPGIGLTARELMDVPAGALLASGDALLERILEEEQLPDAERRVVLGLPADRLADVADEEAAELIVVGSRGRGAFKAAFLGSLSTSLLAVARCPVLVVPPRTTSTLARDERRKEYA
jgi:nucleotide-binding universal stress UspA family protein